MKLDDIDTLRKELEGDASDRHEDYVKLLYATNGNYYDAIISDTWKKWQGVIYEGQTSNRSDRYKIHTPINILNSIIARKRSLWALVPSVRCPYRDLSDEAVRNSVNLERAIRDGLWDGRRIGENLGNAGWDAVVLGTTVLGWWPDFERERPTLTVRSPFGFFGTPGNTEADGRVWKNVYFVTRMTGRQAAACFPRAAERIDPGRTSVSVIEYWDEEMKVTYLADDLIPLSDTTENKLGFVPVVTVPYVAQLGRWHGRSGVIDVIPLIGEKNKRYNVENQALSDMAGAPWEAVNADTAPENLSLDPDAINPFTAGGGLRKSQVNLLPYQVFQSNANLDRYIDEVARDPEIMRSVIPGGGANSAKAINALTGPLQAETELQQRYLFSRLEILNKMGMRMWRAYWGEKKHVLWGTERGRKYNLEIDLRDFDGFYENEVYLDSSAFFDTNSAVVIGLEMVQNNSLSIKTFNTRINPYVDDPDAEQAQIEKEMQQRAIFAAQANVLAQQAMNQFPQMGAAGMQANRLEAGTQGQLPPAPPPPGMNAGELRFQARQAGGEVEGEVEGDLATIANLIRSTPNTKGQIFLSGSIIEGEIGPEGIEIWFTDMNDWATVRQFVYKQRPDLKGVFTPYSGMPNVPYIEVTPGSNGLEVSGGGAAEEEAPVEAAAPPLLGPGGGL